jgi:hypothetical protein
MPGETNKVEIRSTYGASRAHQVIRASMEDYEQLIAT